VTVPSAIMTMFASDPSVRDRVFQATNVWRQIPPWPCRPFASMVRIYARGAGHPAKTRTAMRNRGRWARSGQRV